MASIARIYSIYTVQSNWQVSSKYLAEIYQAEPKAYKSKST